jgi:hypothetical protein
LGWLSAHVASIRLPARKVKPSPTILTPFALARKATRLMDTDCDPAARARPLGLLAPDKILYPGGAYGLEILDHAHPVFRPVTLIEVCQQLAWKA